MAAKLLNVGFGNTVAAARVIAIVDPGSAPMKRLKDEAKQAGKLVDATNGRRTRSIIVTDSDHIVLSAIQTETIAQRFEADVVSDASVRIRPQTGRPNKGVRAE